MYMKANGRKAYEMDLAYNFSQIVHILKVIGKMIKQMDKVV